MTEFWVLVFAEREFKMVKRFDSYEEARAFSDGGYDAVRYYGAKDFSALVVPSDEDELSDQDPDEVVDARAALNKSVALRKAQL